MPASGGQSSEVLILVIGRVVVNNLELREAGIVSGCNPPSSAVPLRSGGSTGFGLPRPLH
jgi:hypothetical protein